jgi:four helix bundle protein
LQRVFPEIQKKEYVQFLYVARGSLSETINHLMLIKDLGYCDKELFEQLNIEYEILSKQMNSLISIIKKDYEK